MSKITVAGIGYVGLSNAVLLSQNNEVVLIDVVQEKIDMINRRESPIDDSLIGKYLKEKTLNLRATNDKMDAYTDADFLIIAVPTDYNPETNYFNTSLIETVAKDAISINPNITIVIKSTIPIFYTEGLKSSIKYDKIYFSPEFLREGTALYDNLNPSRIIIGSQEENAKEFVQLLLQGTEKQNVDVLYVSNTDAEAIKLFANGYLAMRVSYFNEVDSYCEQYGLNSKNVIQGVGLDPRIGTGYNNPSFGYGGYCFPKDSLQLAANFSQTPNALIQSIHKSNFIRKSTIVSNILSRGVKTVGIHRLVMKAGSDNFRSSAIIDIMAQLRNSGINIVIYEPTINSYEDYVVENQLNTFKDSVDLIVSNRLTDDIKDVEYKVYTRDCFGGDS